MDLTTVVESYYDVQSVRIGVHNRASALVRDGEISEEEADEFFGFSVAKLKEIEKDWEHKVAEVVKDVPIWQGFLKDVKGIGPMMAGCLLSMIDVSKAPHASSVWKYFGMDVRNGRAPRRERGKKSDWNAKGRTLCFKIASQFLQAKGPYSELYYTERARLEQKSLQCEFSPDGNGLCHCAFPDQKDECLERLQGAASRKNRTSKKPPCAEHIHRAASRKMVKIFLANLWERWRKMEGLPVSEPYAIDRLGHTHKIEVA